MIFVHSSFRVGSTYVWSRFRQAPNVVAYYEIFNETLATVTPATLSASRSHLWHSKHPAGAPYFLEFLPLLKPAGGVTDFDADMSVKRFIPIDGQLSDTEIRYVGRLVSHAEARGRIPVLTASRSLGRLRALKTAFPGCHLLLYRGLFQQWCSFSEQAWYGNNYFLDTIAAIVRNGRHDPVLATLQELIPLDVATHDNPHSFLWFVFLHLHVYVQAAGSADLVLDLNRLATDPAHRAAAEHCVAGQSVEIDLSGTTNGIAYSLHPAGRDLWLNEQIDVLGSIVIDAAPDEAGRQFGQRVLADLHEERDRFEFYAGGLRSIIVGPGGLLKKQEDTAARAAIAENAQVAAQQQLADMQTAHASLQSAHQSLLAEHAAFTLAKEQLEARLRDMQTALKAAERAHELSARERQSESVQRQQLQALCNGMRAERDTLTERLHLLAGEAERLRRIEVGRHGLQRAYEQACEARDTARMAADDISARLSADLQDLRARHDSIVVSRTVWLDFATTGRDTIGMIVRRRYWQLIGRDAEGAARERRRWRRKGDAARDARKWRQAAEAYERFLRFAPGNSAIWIQYGHARKEAGDLVRAIHAYEESRLLDPGDTERDEHLARLRTQLCREPLAAGAAS